MVIFNIVISIITVIVLIQAIAKLTEVAFEISFHKRIYRAELTRIRDCTMLPPPPQPQEQNKTVVDVDKILDEQINFLSEWNKEHTSSDEIEQVRKNLDTIIIIINAKRKTPLTLNRGGLSQNVRRWNN